VGSSDELEELLAENDIPVPSRDREGGEEEACLYGAEYCALEDGVVGVVMEEYDGGSQRNDPTHGGPRRANVPPLIRNRMQTALG
jgi:hypothetical protein